MLVHNCAAPGPCGSKGRLAQSTRGSVKVANNKRAKYLTMLAATVAGVTAISAVPAASAVLGHAFHAARTTADTADGPGIRSARLGQPDDDYDRRSDRYDGDSDRYGRPGGGGWDSLPRGSWAASCRNAQMSGRTLRADCKVGSRWRTSEINPRRCSNGRIGNYYGTLVCEGTTGSGSGGGGGSLPSGSWAGSCRNAQMYGSTLSADCKVGSNWRSSQLNMRQCKNGRAGNAYGRLICE